MRTRAIWIGVVLVLGVSGLAVSQALSLERLVDLSRLAAPPALAQETRPPASPVLRSRFGLVVPAGWRAPRLVEEPARPGQPLLTRLGLPSAHAADMALPPVSGLSLVKAAGVGPWPRPIPMAASVMHYQPALGSVSPEDCAEAVGGRQPLGSTIADKMPDKCDDKLFGVWLCGSVDSGTGGRPVADISRTIDENGFEKIRWITSTNPLFPWSDPIVRSDLNYVVDREWHPHPNPDFKDQLYRVSCNGVDRHGYKKLTLSRRNADLSDPTGSWTEYVVDSNGLLWINGFDLRRDGDKKWGESIGELDDYYCRLNSF